MRGILCGVICLLFVSGCSSKPTPEVLAAAEQILKLGGSFTLEGLTIPVKKGSKFPAGSLPIRIVDLNGLKVKDADIEPLKNLPHLEELRLEQSHVTDAGLAHLQVLKQLQILDLHKSLLITDKGIEALAPLSKLHKLELSYTRVTDGAVNALVTLKGLKTLHLSGTRITADGLKKIREGLPKCEVLK